jgi:hypothetical protein
MAANTANQTKAEAAVVRAMAILAADFARLGQ